MSNGTYTPADPAVIAALQGIQAAQEAIEIATQAIQASQAAILTAQNEIALAQAQIATSAGLTATATQSLATSAVNRTATVKAWLAARWNRLDGNIYPTTPFIDGRAAVTLLRNSPIAGGEDANAKVNVSSGAARVNGPAIDPKRNL